MSGADELTFVIGVIDDWAAREHPGDREASDRARSATVKALVGGASLFEALAAGRSAAADRPLLSS